MKVPTLDEIATTPALVMGLPLAELVTLQLKLAAIQAATAAALVKVCGVHVHESVHVVEDRMLTVDEAAKMLRRDRRWIYSHADKLPFVIRVSQKSLLCSEAGVRKWLAARMAK